MLLNLHKPAGVTSRDVVNQVQRLARPLKCGHAGTLDPLATGVLLVCLGKGTRLVPYLHELPKTYLATFLTHRWSDTEDITGEVTLLPESAPLTSTAIQEVLSNFLGEIQQTPPQYSALKVGGERAYAAARRGEAVALAARPIMIHSLELVACQEQEFQLRIVCGSGTYIRSLGRDIARALGTECVMSALVRESIGPFQLQSAVSPEHLTRENFPGHLFPASSALSHLPTTQVTGEVEARLRKGQPLTRDNALYSPLELRTAQFPPEQILLGDRHRELVAAVDSRGELIAVLEPRPQHWWPIQVFAEARGGSC